MPVRDSDARQSRPQRGRKARFHDLNSPNSNPDLGFRTSKLGLWPENYVIGMWRKLFEFVARLWNASASAPAFEAAAPSAQQTEPARLFAPEQLQQLMGRVSELTTAVAQDVGEHNKSVQAISDELRSVAQSDPSAVAAIVCKLLVANQELQGRLEQAEGTLQTHSRELRDAVETARTDALTGLVNRRALDEKLSDCLAEFQAAGKPTTLMFLDVDGFKQFNDTYGHLIGDKCLVHVAAVLRSRAHATDCVARFGGEEFVVVFEGQSAAEVRQRAETLRRSIGQRPMIIEGCTKTIRVSGGLAELARDETIADWLKRADAALYAAKRNGRDCTFEMNGPATERIVLVTNEPQCAGVKDLPQRPVFEAAAELAAEAFADTSFVPSVARRIAEWRRGGTTLTVMLARLDRDEEAIGSLGPESNHAPIRFAMHAARACLREMDLITRWQNDGIAMLLPNTSAQDTKTVARRLRNALAAESVGGQVSLSMGIAEGIEGNDAKRVLERAWLALETARSSRPGGIAVHDGLKPVAMKLVGAAK
jgi:diguanylate cyclase